MSEVRTTSSTGGQKGTKLARFDLIPVGPLTELAEHFGVGASKYANHQWRKGYEWSKSYAALMRHLTAFWAGYDYDVCSNDPEGCSHVDTEGNPFTAVREDACFNHTGSHHMAAVAWHAFCLLEFKDQYPEHDDRYKPEEKEPEDPFGFFEYLPGARTVDHPRPRFTPVAHFVVDGGGTVTQYDVNRAVQTCMHCDDPVVWHPELGNGGQWLGAHDWAHCYGLVSGKRHAVKGPKM